MLIIPNKVNAGLPEDISRNDLLSIVGWFEKHQRSFYILGWSYLRNQQQLEELFYQTILKARKDFPKIKSKTTFDIWVTRVFIDKCRELAASGSIEASEESDAHEELFNALEQLKGEEREALVFTYLQGLSSEETASLLQLSVKEVKELLVSGIQSLRNGLRYGDQFNGCAEYQKFYLDYLGRNMERPLKIDFEKHIYHCPECQEDLASFQEVTLQLAETLEEFQVPAGFMKGVKERIAETENRRQQKAGKRNRLAFIAASVFVLVMCTGFFTGAFADVYYKWKEEDPELRAFLRADLGERLNLEAESNGVKIKIKSVVADKYQTLIFYEIEDTKKNNKYMINYEDGVSVQDDWEIFKGQFYPQYQPPNLDSDLNKKEQNIYHGKLSLPPLKEDSGTIKLNITQMMKLPGDYSVQGIFNPYGNQDYKKGEWDFEIYADKKPSTEYKMDEEVKVEGVTVRLKKLTLSPTATILEYGINNRLPKKRLDNINFKQLEVNGEELKADLYGSLASSAYNNQAQFEPFFEKRANKVKLYVNQVYLSFQDNKVVELDAQKDFPQTFEYAGSTISIEKLELGESTSIIISNHEKERSYNTLDYGVLTEEGQMHSIETGSEGVLIDKNGKEYDANTLTTKEFEKLENPRYITTEESIKIHEKNVIPKALEFYGYRASKYLDEVFDVSLN
ncbi:DUF4179 domain-containing protein [Bacillus infantis]|uniref:DUF4179 domain-containing protein n=1 Tax=Bacillus infantis TaxID=324767 RepID=UPI003CFA2EA1